MGKLDIRPPLTSLDPLHYWKASNIIENSGVEQIIDLGSGAKNFVQLTASKKCTRAQDARGKWYLAPDGVDDTYSAGVASDWDFLATGNFSILAVWEPSGVEDTSTQVLVDNSILSTSSSGIVVTTSISTGWANGLNIYNGSTAFSISTRNAPLTRQVCCYRCHNTGYSTALAFEGYQNGYPINKIAISSFGSTSSYALTLFTSANGTAFPTRVHLYELVILNRPISDFEIQNYLEWTYYEYGWVKS